MNSKPEKHEAILISFTERQVETGCQATNRNWGPLEVNLNFQRNPIKMQALRRQTLAGHFCVTLGKRRYFLTTTLREIGPGCHGCYKSQHFLLCSGNVQSVLKQRLFVYLLSLFSWGHFAILLLRQQEGKDKPTAASTIKSQTAFYWDQTCCTASHCEKRKL